METTWFDQYNLYSDGFHSSYSVLPHRSGIRTWHSHSWRWREGWVKEWIKEKGEGGWAQMEEEGGGRGEYYRTCLACTVYMFNDVSTSSSKALLSNPFLTCIFYLHSLYPHSHNWGSNHHSCLHHSCRFSHWSSSCEYCHHRCHTLHHKTEEKV